jgi:hypothetical protein
MAITGINRAVKSAFRVVRVSVIFVLLPVSSQPLFPANIPHHAKSITPETWPDRA